MLPEVETVVEDLLEDIDTEEETSRTYKLHIEQGRILGVTDELDAMRQAVYKILNTERFEYPMYSDHYGIELRELIGQDVVYVIPELERRVREALLADDRIEDVTDFSFAYREGCVMAAFTVQTVFGELNETVEVEI